MYKVLLLSYNLWQFSAYNGLKFLWMRINSNWNKLHLGYNHLGCNLILYFEAFAKQEGKENTYPQIILNKKVRRSKQIRL